MVKIEKKIHGTKLITVWFAEKEIKDKGILIYKESKVAIGKSNPFYTLISDLTEDADAIMQHFTKNCRNLVRRGYKENVQTNYLSGEKLGDKEITEFIEFFTQFWNSKGVEFKEADSLKQELMKYSESGSLYITQALVEGEVVVYHTYICDDRCARLLHSASLYRTSDMDDNKKRNLIGIANRMLHYEDMLYLKNTGLKEYDWGGAGKEEEVASITEFKESFGGTPQTYYDCEKTVGLKAKIISTLSAIRNGKKA